jgi:hypothetical protein
MPFHTQEVYIPRLRGRHLRAAVEGRVVDLAGSDQAVW